MASNRAFPDLCKTSCRRSNPGFQRLRRPLVLDDQSCSSFNATMGSLASQPASKHAHLARAHRSRLDGTAQPRHLMRSLGGATTTSYSCTPPAPLGPFRYAASSASFRRNAAEMKPVLLHLPNTAPSRRRLCPSGWGPGLVAKPAVLVVGYRRVRVFPQEAFNLLQTLVPQSQSICPADDLSSTANIPTLSL